MVRDKSGRPIRPLVWFHHTDTMCDADLLHPEWQSGRTTCKTKATINLANGKHLCGRHAATVRKGATDWRAGIVTVEGKRIHPEDIAE